MQLIVLIHGMWGRAADFNYVVDQLKIHNYIKYEHLKSNSFDFQANGTPMGVVYCTHSNEGYFTYDGIDVCGVRVADEICQVLETIKQQDLKITQLSIVGYSMGGLMARYAIGILDRRGVFSEQLKPHVFITTCSPHVGVNVLGPSLGSKIFNFIGSWSMARTSRQAFLCDKDQPYQMPLFLCMTEAQTPWVRALKKFERRVLYANIANDRRCEFYTASVNSSDPFSRQDLTTLSGPFVPGYEPIVLKNETPRFYQNDGSEKDYPDNSQRRYYRWGLAKNWIVQKILRTTRLGWLVVRVGIVIPIWFCAFLINACYQFVASKLRTRVRSSDISDMLEESASGIVENMYRTVATTDRSRESASGALALTPLMRRVIDHFNAIGFEKYYLSILNTHMAHSAAIVKFNKPEYYSGKLAVMHMVRVLVD